MSLLQRSSGLLGALCEQCGSYPPPNYPADYGFYLSEGKPGSVQQGSSERRGTFGQTSVSPRKPSKLVMGLLFLVSLHICVYFRYTHVCICIYIYNTYVYIFFAKLLTTQEPTYSRSHTGSLAARGPLAVEVSQHPHGRSSDLMTERCCKFMSPSQCLRQSEAQASLLNSPYLRKQKGSNVQVIGWGILSDHDWGILCAYSQTSRNMRKAACNDSWLLLLLQLAEAPTARLASGLFPVQAWR